MVGSVLIERMLENGDFNFFKATLFSTTEQKELISELNSFNISLECTHNIEALIDMDIIVVCQGSQFSKEVLPLLRHKNWAGYWIDSASYYRMNKDSVIVLDPVNRRVIDEALESGVKNYIGGNCTVSLLILAIHGLIKENMIDWVSTMSYQAISGAGSKALLVYLQQMRQFLSFSSDIDYSSKNILTLESKIRNFFSHQLLKNRSNEQCSFCNILPYIGNQSANFFQASEELKLYSESNKILGKAKDNKLIIDGICVRVPTLRSHSQALTIKTKKSIGMNNLIDILKNANPWVKLIENDPQNTLDSLTPFSVAGSLDIAVGRLKQTHISDKHINLFTVGDQLIWGAAEPLRRMLMICIESV